MITDRKYQRRSPPERHSDSRNLRIKSKPEITQNRVISKSNCVERILYSPQKLIGHRNTVIILIIRPDNHEVIKTLVNEFLIHD